MLLVLVLVLGVPLAFVRGVSVLCLKLFLVCFGVLWGGGRHANTLHSKKYGAGIIRFTHAGNTVIHTSTKNNANNGKQNIG